MHGRSVNTIQTHTGHTVSTHFGGHNSDQLTRGHIRMGTTPESTAQPLTALTTNHSLHPACMHATQCSRSHGHTVGWAESFAGDASNFIHPLQSGSHNGRGDHFTPSALRGPCPPEWTGTEHPIVNGMCACVCCVSGPLVPVTLLQLTGLRQSWADTNPLTHSTDSKVLIPEHNRPSPNPMQLYIHFGSTLKRHHLHHCI